MGKYLDRDATLTQDTHLDVTDAKDTVDINAVADIRGQVFVNTKINVVLEPAAVVRLISELTAIAVGNGWMIDPASAYALSTFRNPSGMS